MTQFKCFKLFGLSEPGCIKAEKDTGDLKTQRKTEKRSKKGGYSNICYVTINRKQV